MTFYYNILRRNSVSTHCNKMSKKGQLAFISIFIMLIILYFIFQSNQSGYKFTMYMGDNQNHFLTSLQAPEQAKIYLSEAARQSAYEVAYIAGPNTASNSCFKCLTDFQQNFENNFTNYLLRYAHPAPENPLFAPEIDLPDYNWTVSCAADKITLEGFGYRASCVDVTPYPQNPCEDIVNQADCESTQACQMPDPNDPKSLACGGSGACKWSDGSGFCADGTLGGCPDLNLNASSKTYCTSSASCEWHGCSDNTAKPEKICEGNSQTDCGNIPGCKWKVSIPETIQVTSLPNLDYQFTVSADAHIKEEINCAQYGAFYESRKNAKPT